MASFSFSTNHSFYQKQMIEKAFQNLLEESIHYECPSLIKKFANTSELNLSSVRADLFTSMKLNQSSKKWRKELKKKSKRHREKADGADKSNIKPESEHLFKKPSFAPSHKRSRPSTTDSNFPFQDQFIWKPGSSNPKLKGDSEKEFVIPNVLNMPLAAAAQGRNRNRQVANKVRTVSGGSSTVEPSGSWIVQPNQGKEPLSATMDNSWVKECNVASERPSKEIKNHQKKHRQKNLNNNNIKSSRNDYVFDEWIFRIDSTNDVFIKGHLSGSPADEFWSTSEIVERINNRTLLTASGKMCILQGEIMKRALISKGYPVNLVERFSDGFPVEWKDIIRSNQIPKLEQKSSRHEQTVKKNTRASQAVQEEDEDEKEETDDEEEDKEFKLSMIRENPQSALKVEKVHGNGEDFLFNVFSHTVKRNSPMKIPQIIIKKLSPGKAAQRAPTERVSPARPTLQIRTRSMTKSLRPQNKKSLTMKSADASKQNQNNIKIIPKDSTMQKQNPEEFGSPHPLSNTINTSPLKPLRKVSGSNERKKSSAKKSKKATKSVTPSKSRSKKKTVRSKDSVKLKDSKKKKSPSLSKKSAKSKKPQNVEENKDDDNDCANKENPKVPSSKKNPSQSHKKGKEKERKMIADWTKEEKQKLLSAMSSLPKSDAKFWQKVALKVGRSAEECANYYCSCDLSNFDWQDTKKNNKEEEKKKEPKLIKRKNLHIYDVSDSYEDDLFESEKFLGNTKKIHLNQDCHLDDIFADLSVRTPSADHNFQTPLSKFFLTPVSECQTPSSTFSDGDIKVDWDNADRCVKEFKKNQKKGAGRLKVSKRLLELKTEFKPKVSKLENLVDELNKINNIPSKEDEADDSNQNVYFSSESD